MSDFDKFLDVASYKIFVSEVTTHFDLINRQRSLGRFSAAKSVVFVESILSSLVHTVTVRLL